MKTRLLLTLAALCAASVVPATALDRIAFGSCNHQDRPQPCWDAIVAFRPQLWIWLGDNIYGDTTDMTLLAAKWEKQRQNPGYRRLMAECAITGIWDDHDYGVNDGGKDFPVKAASQNLFLSFLQVPPDDPRWMQSGIYASEVFGSPGRQVRVLLLDVRTHRDKPGPEADILGEDQWKWLKATLSENSADVTIIASGSQFLPSEHPFEKWSDYPKSRERLLGLLKKYGRGTMILLSGDRHHGEISKLDSPALYEVTSSSLTHSIKSNAKEPNALRIGPVVTENNFGTISIDWKKRSLEMAIRSQAGKALVERVVSMK